ncbi:hypothetical protein [Pseudodesulfovibrio sediminis]|uniref:hypothetical protein n=1 Tax=Pseudodesulfovibrio sediminis TaxID=2810563 RepID=UPI001E2BC438|nr:hypothetical protein [Pseudodesulfovibrio sediminis]
MLNAIHSGEIGIDSSNIPNLKIWFSYYRNNKRLFSELIAVLVPNMSWQNGTAEFSFKEIQTGKGPIAPGGGVSSIVHAFIPQQGSETGELEWDTSPPAMLFFLLIWVPCNCLYGENPPELFFRARHGDLKAARKLIRLDKSLMTESGIARKIQQWSANGETENLTKLGSYLGETIPRVSLQQVKITWARFILKASQRDGTPFSAPKIQGLFNAVAQDSGRGIQDPDIGEMSPESFAKALNRKNGFWQLAPRTKP